MGSAGSKLRKPVAAMQPSKSAAKDAALGKYLSENLRLKIIRETEEKLSHATHSQTLHPEPLRSALQTRTALNAEGFKHPERFISWNELPSILSDPNGSGGTKDISSDKLAELKKTFKLIAK
jgi:hypothetical protein